MISGLSMEQALVWRCCRSVIASTKDSAMPELIGKIIHWDTLLNYARWHGVMPLLNQALAPHKAAMPSRVVEELTVAYVNALKHNLFLASELLKVLELFESHGIQAVPFKGIMLSACVYGNMAFHRASDLDILVHREDVPRIKTLLAQAGYPPNKTLSAAQEQALLKQRNEYHVLRLDGQCCLDIHWQMVYYFDSFLISTDDIWADLRTTRLSGRPVPTLSPEHLLLLLCIHGSNHCWYLLSMTCDLARAIMAHHTIAWDKILARAERQGIKRMVLLGFRLAAQIMNIILPPAIQNSLFTDPRADRLAHTVINRLTNKRSFRLQRMRLMAFHLRVLSRTRDKIRYLFRILITTSEKDWACCALPRSLFALYIFIRPLRFCLDAWKQWRNRASSRA